MPTLHVFDFDDTLVSSESSVRIEKSDGTLLSLSSEEYASYTPEPDDQQDFSDFDAYPKHAELIEPVFAELRAAIAMDGPGSVVILTARSNPEPVRLFMKNNKIPAIHIEATGSSNPMDKARYVLDRVMNDDYDTVRVFEDNVRNLRTIRKVVSPTGIKLQTNRVSSGVVTDMSESSRLFLNTFSLKRGIHRITRH